MISKVLHGYPIVKCTPQKTLLGPDQKTLPVIGQVTASLKSEINKCSQTVYRSTSHTSTIEQVKQVGLVEDKTFDPQKVFPALFRNLGKLRPY